MPWFRVCPLASKRHPHTEAVTRVQDDMRKVLDTFGEVDFMNQSVSPKTQKRRELLASAAPDLQQMLAEGMPTALVEKLARMDQES